MSVALIRGYDSRYSLSDLWSQVFGDDPEFISAMYESGYLHPSDIFALTDDGRLVSALFLPEYRIFVNGSERSIRLLSCVVTDPAHRGKGYMSRMIPRVLELIRQEPCAGVCVIPVSENLFSFYEQFGFSTAFYLSEQIFETATVPPVPVLRVDADQAHVFYETYRDKYARDGVVLKTETRFLQAVSEYNHPTQPCEFCSIGQGFAFIQKSASEITVREWAGVSAEVLASSLIAKYALPVRLQDLPSGETRPIAMLYSYSEELSDLAKNNGLYLNCMYN